MGLPKKYKCSNLYNLFIDSPSWPASKSLIQRSWNYSLDITHYEGHVPRGAVLSHQQWEIIGILSLANTTLIPLEHTPFLKYLCDSCLSITKGQYYRGSPMFIVNHGRSWLKKYHICLHQHHINQVLIVGGPWTLTTFILKKKSLSIS